MFLFDGKKTTDKSLIARCVCVFVCVKTQLKETLRTNSHSIYNVMLYNQ